MNRKLILAVSAALIAFVVVMVLWRAQDTENGNNAISLQNEPASQHQAPTEESSSPTLAPSATGSKGVDSQHKVDVRKGLEAIVEGLKKLGAKEVPPIAETLKEEMASGDPGNMRRAFHEATYGRFAKMSESIPAMKAYLSFSDPYVRYLASEALLRVGDQSGVVGQVELASSNAPIMHGENDLRIEAARSLGQYGDKRAVSALVNLYEATNDGGVLNALARIQGNNPSPQVISFIMERQTPGFVAFNLGLSGLSQGEVIVRETFDAPKVPENYAYETKVIAAWALARMTGSEKYVSFLGEAARPAIERKENNSLSYDDSTKALKYLGSVQSPQAVKVLEQALESQNPVAVQYATVNLLFNQPGGSQKAEQVLLDQFAGKHNHLPWVLAMQVASKLDNPQIRAAAESHAARTGSDSWRYWGVERANWPIENWIYDYVVTLNR